MFRFKTNQEAAAHYKAELHKQAKANQQQTLFAQRLAQNPELRHKSENPGAVTAGNSYTVKPVKSK